MQENKILNTNDFKKKNWEHLVKREIPQTTTVLIHDKEIDANGLDCELELEENGDKLYLSFYLNSDEEDWLPTLKQRCDNLIMSHKNAKQGDETNNWVLLQTAITRANYESQKNAGVMGAVMNKIVKDILEEEKTYEKAFKKLSSIQNLYIFYKKIEEEMIKQPLM